MERPSPPSTVRDTVSPAVEHAVLKALAKLPADLFATAAEFATALVDRSFTTNAGRAGTLRADGTVRRARWRDPLVLGLGGVALVLAGALAVATRSSADADPFPVRLEINGSVESRAGLTGGALSTETPRGSAVLSDDGHTVVYIGAAAAGTGTVLYARRLDQTTAREIPGSANPQSPVFSPDSRWVAFVAARKKIVKVPLDGGAPVVLADVADDGGIDWSSSGEIVFGSGVFEGLKGLSRVSANGGTATQAFTRVDSTRKELSHQWPRVLADGKTVLFTIWHGAPELSEIGVASLDDGKVTPLGVIGGRALGVVAGHLVYVRPDGVAMAAPFDIGRRRVTGPATPVQDSIRVLDASGEAVAFLNKAGGLVFARGALNRRLVWVDRSGASRPALSTEREFVFVRISPDGKQVAVSATAGGKGDLWLFDIATSTLTPLTASSTARNPVWSSDGKRILFISTQGGRSAFWWQPVDGSGPAVRVADAPHNAWNIDLAPDGRTTVFNAIYDGTFNVESFALDSTHERHDVSASPNATEALARFSPDGRSVAYMSDESGQPEIYVRSFPEGGNRIQVSGGGGTRPVWSRDGKTLYYREGSRMVAAALTRDPALRVASRQALFDGPYDREFDVSPDGSRFLMIETRSSGMSLVVIPNWLTELHRLTAKSAR